MKSQTDNSEDIQYGVLGLIFLSLVFIAGAFFGVCLPPIFK